MSAIIVGGEPIPKGPEFEPEVAALVRKLLETLLELDRITKRNGFLENA